MTEKSELLPQVEASVLTPSPTSPTVEDIDLPFWLRKVLPEHLPHTELAFVNGKLRFSHNGAEFLDYDSACDYADRLEDSYQLALDPSLEGHGGRFSEGSTNTFNLEEVLPDGTVEKGGYIFARHTELNETRLRETYRKWITETVPAYDSNPDHFLTAFRWLSQHPIFWLRAEDGNDYEWLTSSGLKSVEVGAYSDKQENLVVYVSPTGQHDRSSNYQKLKEDPELSISAPTYEEVIIKLAKKVRGRYRLDGTPQLSYSTINGKPTGVNN